MIKPTRLIILLLLFGNLTSAQEAKVNPDFEVRDTITLTTNLNLDYFLLGTFSDYMGRFRYIDRKTQVDRYYPYEKPLAEYISDFILKNYRAQVKPKYSDSGHSEIYSEEIALKLHSYYTGAGVLKEDSFDTPEKKYSFLTGIILRNGELLFDDVFRVNLANSYNGQLVYSLIKDLGCDKIIYKIRRNNVPVTQVFYFKATPKIMAYYYLIKDINKTIGNNRGKQLYSNTKRKGKAEIVSAKRDEEEVKNIKYVFEL